jgi:homoprotocatechuate degradation regulator HpaR
MAARPRIRPPGAQVATAVTFRYPPFDKSLPMLLLAVREGVTHRFHEQNKAYGLTEQQWRVLRALGEGAPLEITALGARCRILPASLSRMLPKLREAGLISRGVNANDHRMAIVALTERGQRLLESAQPVAARIYEQLSRDIGAERLARLYAMLEEIISLLEAADRNGTSTRSPVRPAHRRPRKSRGGQDSES